MKKTLFFLLILLLPSCCFSAEPLLSEYDLKTSFTYDKPQAMATISEKGLTIKVKKSNFSWGHTYTMPEDSRYLDQWEVDLDVISASSASYGIAMGHEKVGVQFQIDNSGRYLFESWSGDKGKKIMEGHFSTVALPCTVKLKYDTTKSLLEAFVNGKEVKIINLEDIPNVPQLNTIKQVYIRTSTEWGKANGIVTYSRLKITANSSKGGNLPSYAVPSVSGASSKMQEKKILEVPYYKQKGSLCGNACVQMVAGYYGTKVTQDEINKIANIGVQRGIYSDEFSNVLDKLKIKNKKPYQSKVDYAFYFGKEMEIMKGYIDAGHPVIVGLWYDLKNKKNEDKWNFDNFVVLVGYDNQDQKFFVHDPTDGPETEIDFAEWSEKRKNKEKIVWHIECIGKE